MHIYLIIVYTLLMLVWGGVTYHLVKDILSCKKRKVPIPTLIAPFAVSSLSLCLENLYFGIVVIDRFLLGTGIEYTLVEPDYWILPKIFILCSGIFIYLKLRKS